MYVIEIWKVQRHFDKTYGIKKWQLSALELIFWRKKLACVLGQWLETSIWLCCCLFVKGQQIMFNPASPLAIMLLLRELTNLSLGLGPLSSKEFWH